MKPDMNLIIHITRMLSGQLHRDIHQYRSQNSLPVSSIVVTPQPLHYWQGSSVFDGNGILIIAMLLKISVWLWLPCDIVPRSRQRGNYTSIVCHEVTCWTIHVCHYTFCCQIHFMFHSLDATSICVLDELYLYTFINCGWGTQFLG